MIFSAELKRQIQTQFPIEPRPIFSPKDAFFFIGSCFSDEISKRLQNHYFNTYSNPFGTVFTSNAILKNLRFIAGLDPLNIQQFQNQWHFLDGSSRFQHPDKLVLEQSVLQIQSESFQKIKSANLILITLGTAYYYEWSDQNYPVANCHKIPQKYFRKNRFSHAEIKIDLEQINNVIKQINPDAKLLFTISPVRHLRDGIRENLLSKSLLYVALDEFLRQHGECIYFPSFEIAQEELRDHHFFKSDLAHMNDWATEYIFLRFIETLSTPETRKFFEKAAALSKRIQHENFENRKKTTLDEEWMQHRQHLLSEYHF
jgi:hypothetical protein